MKLSISNIAWNNESDACVYSLMNKYGFIGLEIAPTKIFGACPYERIADAERFRTKIREENGFEIPSIQSIWYGKQENIFSSDAEREDLFQYTKDAVDFAAAIGARNLVFGCPRNRNVPPLANVGVALEFFHNLGEYAVSRGTVIGMEANPPIYNTNYINETAQAIDLIKSVNSKGFKLNFDFGTSIYNKETFDALEMNPECINHVHISEPGLAPVKVRESHKVLAGLLRDIDYSGFVSIEMGFVDDVSVIEDCMKYVSEVFL